MFKNSKWTLFVLLVVVLTISSGCSLLGTKPEEKDPDPVEPGYVLVWRDDFEAYEPGGLASSDWVPAADGKAHLILEETAGIDGSQGVRVENDTSAMRRSFGESFEKGKLVISFYDEFLEDSDQLAMACGFGGIWYDIIGGVVDKADPIWAGVNQRTSKYSFRNHAFKEGKWTVFDVERTKGWHTLEYVCDGTKTDLFLDGVLVRTINEVTSFKGLSVVIGSYWATTQKVVFDNIEVYKYVD